MLHLQDKRQGAAYDVTDEVCWQGLAAGALGQV
jgi:hypothetical protein